MTADEKNKRVQKAGAVGSSIGFVGGLVYAFKTKKGFWGYVGYSVLFSLIGGTVSSLPAFIMLKEDNSKAVEDKKNDLAKLTDSVTTKAKN